MSPRFTLLAPVLLVSALAFSASLSAQDKTAEKPAVKPADQPAEKAVPPVAAKPALAAGETPTATAVLERAGAAIGGNETWLKIKSMDVQGKIEISGQGILGTQRSYSAAPNKLVVVGNLSGIGEFQTGYDGTVGWSVDPISGPRLLEGGELEMTVRQADMLKDTDPVKRWDKVEFVGEGEFGGFSCWKLKATKGATEATLWFEKESGLQRGLETIVESPYGQIPVSTALVQYREFEGAFGKIKLPVRSEAMQMGQKIVTTVESVTFDAVDAKIFELPVAIKALLEPEPAEEGDAPATVPAAPTAPAAPATPAAPAKPAEPSKPTKEG